MEIKSGPSRFSKKGQILILKNAFIKIKGAEFTPFEDSSLKSERTYYLENKKYKRFPVFRIVSVKTGFSVYIQKSKRIDSGYPEVLMSIRNVKEAKMFADFISILTMLRPGKRDEVNE